MVNHAPDYANLTRICTPPPRLAASLPSEPYASDVTLHKPQESVEVFASEESERVEG